MKTKRIFLSVLVALLFFPISGVAENGKDIKLENAYIKAKGRSSIPSVDATLYSNYILLDINRYYGNVVVEVENVETGESVSSEYFVSSRGSFIFGVSSMPEGVYIIRLHFDNGMEYVGQFTIEIE